MKTITISDRDFEALERVVSNAKNMMLYMTDHCPAVDVRDMCSTFQIDEAKAVVRAFGLYKNQ